MTRIGTRVGLSLGLALVAFAPLGATAQDQFSVVQAGGIKWAAAPPMVPKGAQIAVLSGDPGKSGQFVIRLKLPSGYKVPAHTHPTDEEITVLSGTLNVGMGDKLDPKKGEALKAGGFVRMPKGMHHYAWSSGETVIQVSGAGPFEVTYINAADDPRKTH